MSAKTIAELFSDFNVTSIDSARRKAPKERASVTIWLTPEAKARFDRLQQVSHRRFGKKVREMILAALDQAEKLAS